MSDFENSRIEKLKRSLYSRDTSSLPKDDRGGVSSQDYDAPKDWGQSPSFEISPDVMVKKSNSFFNKFLAVAVVFFLVSIGVASFIFFGGFNMISSNNVDIKVAGSNSVASGEEIDLNISVINQNSTDLQNAVLYIEYPTGVKQSDITQDSQRVKVDIGTLAKGKSFDYPIKATFFGEKDSVKSITFKMDYNVSGSNALFSKEKTYDVSINSSPIIMDVSYPKEVNSGQEVSINISITSNSAEIVKSNLLKIEYPYGFTYTDSSIKPIMDNSLWNIGDLKNGDKKNLVIKGILVGQNMEDRSFNITVGTSKDSSKDFDTDLAVNQITMGIRKSFFDLAVTSNNENNGGLNMDSSAPISIAWQNTLPDKIINSVITAKISGNVLDKSKISVNNGGLYSSANSSIVWDKNSASSLREIAPGKNGSVLFTIGSISTFPNIKSIKNPHIDISVDITGDRTGLDASTVSSNIQKTIKYNSIMSIIAKSHRGYGGISNTGPIPPRVDQETTYTITWTISNTSNELTGGVASAVLPVGVTWKGETSPSGEKISYNPDSRVVTWNFDGVSYGTGFAYSPREVSFKVGVIPNATQTGQFLVLSSDVNASATDSYTGVTLNASYSGPTTQYSDPDYSNNKGAVVN